MRKTVLYWTAIAGLAACFACGGAAQDTDKNFPQVENAQVEKRALNGSVAAEVKKWMEQTDRARWLGYAVPQIGGERTMCCGDSDGSWKNGCGYCRLEDGDRGNNVTSSDGGTAKLEGPRNLVALLRAENKRATKVRADSEECTLDAGNLTRTWLSRVKPPEAGETLQTFVRGAALDSGDARDML